MKVAKTTPKSKTEENCKFYTKASAQEMKDAILTNLETMLARDPKTANERDWWQSTAFAIRDILMERFIKTMARQNKCNCRRLYYLSLEYLMGRLSLITMDNLGIEESVRKAYEMLGLDYSKVIDSEVDMGLGNGGLGRLAACFLDSLATLNLPAIGYGIRYEFGLFRQNFEEGKQVEYPDNWLKFGCPWEVVRPEYTVKISLGGTVEHTTNDKGDWASEWKPNKEFLGVPWDIPIVGYGAETVNFLRLWESKASNEFDLEAFNEGGYSAAVQEKAMSETVSKVLYPNDKTEKGKYLRLVQQYFFVSCSLQDIIRRFKRDNHENWDAFADKVVIQLNDTHPAIAVPELMRLLIDEQGLDWDYAWSILTKVMAYTNHTLLPEALEKWSVSMFERALPRHLEIIFEINRRWMEKLESIYPGDDGIKRHLSIIEEDDSKMVRMAYMAVIACFSVNGVAAIHSQLLKENLLTSFYKIMPEKFNNKTNGVTPRRWMKTANPKMSKLITSSLGTDMWLKKLDMLKGLEKFAKNADFQKKFMQIKLDNKARLARKIKQLCNIDVNPEALFDVQVKRLHEYKRQHLNLLHIIKLYRDLLHNPDLDIPARVFVFGAKAAPGYDIAKNIIHAINKVGDAINNDKRINDKLKVAFLPNYRVSLAMDIIPAADLSEQISTAGKEASGTGNIKMSLNGALTMGTLDGANIEILEEVGEENIFIFGNTVDQVQELKSAGYNPYDFYNSNPDLKNALDWLVSGYFSPENPEAFMPTRNSVLDWGDTFLVCADFKAYCEAQEFAGEVYKDKSRWAQMAILNVARCGKFSSDRTIEEYASDIWNLKPCGCE